MIWTLRAHRRDGLRHGGFWIGTEHHPNQIRVYRDNTVGWCEQSLEDVQKIAETVCSALNAAESTSVAEGHAPQSEKEPK